MALLEVLPGTGSAATLPTDVTEGDDDGTPVELTTAGGFGRARLMAVSRDGMRLRGSLRLPVGTRSLVRVILARHGVEWTFPCVVAWRSDGALGLAFDGCPTRQTLTRALRKGWQSPLDLRVAWGPRFAMGTA